MSSDSTLKISSCYNRDQMLKLLFQVSSLVYSILLGTIFNLTLSLRTF